MRPAFVARIAAAAALALAVTACGGGPGFAGLAPGSTISQPDILEAHAPACPAPGKIETRGKATAKIVLARAIAGGSVVRVQWQIVFKNLTESESYPRYAFKALAFCGSGMKPRGSIGGGGSYSHNKSCNNGNCTITETIGLNYTPPAKLIRNVFKYDMIRFAPDAATPRYDAVVGALVQVNRAP
jgi:hypothetical protein